MTHQFAALLAMLVLVWSDCPPSDCRDNFDCPCGSCIDGICQ